MKKLRVAITGGIGSGKSSVAEYLQSLAYPVFSCDAIYQTIYPTKEYQAALAALFPSCIKDGAVDRALLASLVFSDKNALEQLNRLSHTSIMDRLNAEMDAAAGDVVFAEVPLLFEGGYESSFDYVIVVLRPLQDRVNAICSRDNSSEEDAKARIRNQFDYDSAQTVGFFSAAKYFLLQNNCDMQSLYKKTDELLSQILSSMKQ